MKLRTTCSGPVETNAYLIIDEQSETAVAIDVPLGSHSWFVEECKRHNVRVTEIWLTHSHWDHMADCEELRRTMRAQVLIHKQDEYRLGDPNKYIGMSVPMHFQSTRADRFITHGDILCIGSSAWEVRHTPGHTEGSVCFIEHTLNVAIVGDTLFRESIGRTDLQGGDHQSLLQSIRHELMVLPDSTLVLPGHMEHTTIGYERVNNPYISELQ